MKCHVNKYVFIELVTISQKVDSKSIKYKTSKLCYYIVGEYKVYGILRIREKNEVSGCELGQYRHR